MHSNFTWAWWSPINHSWRQKTRGTGLPSGEDHTPLHSLVLTQYHSVMDRQTDEQRDRRMDAFAVHARHCKASFLECCKNCQRIKGRQKTAISYILTLSAYHICAAKLCFPGSICHTLHTLGDIIIMARSRCTVNYHTTPSKYTKITNTHPLISSILGMYIHETAEEISANDEVYI